MLSLLLRLLLGGLGRSETRRRKQRKGERACANWVHMGLLG
jgi:hypothetical protein